MSTDDAFYRWGAREEISAENLTKRPMDLHLRVKALEAIGEAVEYIRRQVDDTVLAQAENVLAGLRAQLAAIVDLDWLTGTSTTSVALVAGQERALILPADERVLFAPGPFAVVQRISDPGVYAVVQTLNYDRGLGQFDFTVLTVAGAPGTYADWSIAAVAGSTLAQMTMLAQGQAARDAAAASLAAASADAAQVAADRVAVQRLNDRITVSSLAPTGGQDGDLWFQY